LAEATERIVKTAAARAANYLRPSRRKHRQTHRGQRMVANRAGEQDSNRRYSGQLALWFQPPVTQ
jgi:hypothetical protein